MKPMPKLKVRLDESGELEIKDTGEIEKGMFISGEKEQSK